MKISYYENQTAQKSEPVWQSFLTACKKLGIEPVADSLDCDCALIWSVLWRGRMLKNQEIYNHYRSLGKPVFILEVGSLIRGKTWKVSVNNITQKGIYAHRENHISHRDKKLGLKLLDFRPNTSKPLLIAGQHDQSLQWTYNGTCKDWVRHKIREIRKYSDKEIVVRPHPRNYFNENLGVNVTVDTPIKISGTYDKYNLNFDYSAVINYNSGVGIQSAIDGCPIICDDSSLAYEVSHILSNIDKPSIIDRSWWFNSILHTEWTIEEISEGIPLKRLLSKVDLT